jgi:exopolysaccharide production protein ExoZ
LLAGAVWAHSRKRFQILQTRPWQLIAIGIILVVTGFFVGTTSPFFDRVDIFRTGSFGLAGFDLLLMALALGDIHWRTPRSLMATGDAFYGLYLIHPIILTALGALRFHAIAPDSHWLLPFSLCMPVAMVLISLLWFRWVEKPIFEAIADPDIRRGRVAWRTAFQTK